jgi:hypothetical protein
VLPWRRRPAPPPGLGRGATAKRAPWTAVPRIRAANPPESPEEVRKRQQRISGFYRALGLQSPAYGPIGCWSARCVERRRGLQVPPALSISLDSGEFFCSDCGIRGGLAQAARARGSDPVPLLRQYGFTDTAAVIERREKALEEIEDALEAIGRNSFEWGPLRSARDAARGDVEELERVARRAKRIARQEAKQDG